MKKKAILLAVTLTIITTPAIADMRIESNRGVSQSEWNNTDTYKNFNCPDGYGRGEGVDMNYTTNPSDDYWFAYCVEYQTPIVITPVTPITPTETTTAVITSSVTTNTSTNNSVTETTTTTSNVTESVTFTQLIEKVTALIALVLQLLAKIGA